MGTIRYSTPKVHAPSSSPPRIGYAFWRSKALLSAVELDVFTILAEGPQHLDRLVGRVGIHERGAHDFFDALVALGLLYRDGKDRYGNSADRRDQQARCWRPVAARCVGPYYPPHGR
jgi:hypothetical protein